MATMKVSLPDAMLAWIEGQTRSGRYPNASEYVCAAATRTAPTGSPVCNAWSMRGCGVGLGSGRCGR